MRTLPLTLFLLTSLLALPAAPGHAAPRPPEGSLPGATGALRTQGQAVPAGPVVVEADEIAYDTATNTVTARGRVRVTHPRFRLFADQVTVDLRAQVITAEGRVRLLDAEGRELRAARLVYDVVREAATLTRGETIIERVYLRAAQVEARRDRLTVRDATVTTCDPTRPLYRVTARRVEVIFGEEVVAHEASVWLGSVRLFTVGTYRISLRDPAGPPLPGVGSNATDGVWIDYRYPYRLGELGGELYGKYGTRSGLFALNTLRYERPAWSAALVVGRAQRQDPDLVWHAVTQAELLAEVRPWRIPGVPVALSAEAGFGWFDEVDSAVTTTRLDAAVTLATDTFALGPQTDLGAALTARFSTYGTGAQRTTWTAGLAVTHRVDEATTATLRYDYTAVQGATPFLFDRVDPASTLALSVAHVRPAYRLSAGVAHNFVVPETKVSVGAGYRLSPSFFADVSAVYNLRTQAFEDIDYALTYTCDCLNVTVRYRQVRQEISVQFVFTVSERLALTAPGP